MNLAHDFLIPEHVYATLTPANTLAKLALSDTYDALTARRQNAMRNDDTVHRMQVKSTQAYDDDVCQLQRELE
jgi:hypothetical protein